jgi:phosphoglycolate phosphatase
MSIKAVLFDLDGTLLDTAPDFVSCLNVLRQQESLEPLPAEVIRRCVSNGSRALVTLGFDVNPGENGFDQLLQRLLDIYFDHLTVDTILFPGIQELLVSLRQKNIPWGLVTNKPLRFTQAILEKIPIHPAPICVICPDHVSKTKPDPEPLLLAYQQIGCQANEIIYVGDHKRDIDCGKNAGAITIAVSYGYLDNGDSADNWNADYLVDHASEIEAIVLKHL